VCLLSCSNRSWVDGSDSNFMRQLIIDTGSAFVWAFSRSSAMRQVVLAPLLTLTVHVLCVSLATASADTVAILATASLAGTIAAFSATASSR
jgi:hypothetical protein